jgi:hypothetical protein
MNSIVQSEKECYFTQRTDQLERHHIFYGAGRRKQSDKYGLTVWLTHDLHNEPPNGVHHNKERRRELERIGQQAFQERFPDKDFRKIFGQNYL